MRSIVITVLILISDSIFCQKFDQLLENKKFAEAERYISTAKEIDKPILHSKLGDSYFVNNKLDNAEKHFIAVMDKARLKKLAQKYFEKQHLYKSLFCYKISDNYTTGLSVLAEYFIERRQADSAKKYIKLYIEKKKIKESLFHKMVKNTIDIYIAQKKYKEAISFATEYAYVPTKGYLAEILFAENFLSDAFKFRSCVSEGMVFNNKLGEEFFLRKKYEKSLACYTSAKNMTKINECYVMLAKEKLKEGNVEQAKEMFAKTFATDVMNYEFGNFYYTRGEYETANKFFIKLPPEKEYFSIFEKMAVQMRAINNFASEVIYLKRLGKIEDAKAKTAKLLIDNKNGTISSSEFPFLWQKISAGPMTWDKAKQYCSDLVLAGYKDWSLPDNMAFTSTIQKLIESDSRVVESRFPNIMGKVFWTITKYGVDEKSGQYYTVPLQQGTMQQITNKENSFYVKCYRAFY